MAALGSDGHTPHDPEPPVSGAATGKRAPRFRHRRSDTVARRRRLAIVAALCVLAVGTAVAAQAVVRDRTGHGGRSRASTLSNQGLQHPAAAGLTITTARATTTSAAPGTPPAGAGPVIPPSRSPGPPSVTMLFAGDLLPHGKVDAAASLLGRAAGRAYDFDPLLGAMTPLVSSADLAICHMETPVAPTPAQISGYPAFGAPLDLVRAIHDTGYDGCSTASNHSLDKGKAGIAATVSAFDFAKLGHAGTYISARDAQRIQMYDVKGLKVAHLSYAYGFNGIPLPADAPYAANQIDQARILADARRARAAGAQFVVVSLHWGTEYAPAPNLQQLALAPALAASPDIDLIVGHHVHVVQPIVRDNGKFVVFGMGNQLSSQSQDLRRDGLTVLVTVARLSEGHYAATLVRCIPTYVDATLRVLPVAPALADRSTPPGLRTELEASFARTMAAVNARGVTPGVVAYDPAHP